VRWCGIPPCPPAVESPYNYCPSHRGGAEPVSGGEP
jgi:hypothetical protein